MVARDAGQCAFVSENGRHCGSADFLEYHHLDPWAKASYHSLAGIELRCREHNQYAAEQDFGRAHVARFRERASSLLELVQGESPG